MNNFDNPDDDITNIMARFRDLPNGGLEKLFYRLVMEYNNPFLAKTVDFILRDYLNDKTEWDNPDYKKYKKNKRPKGWIPVPGLYKKNKMNVNFCSRQLKGLIKRNWLEENTIKRGEYQSVRIIRLTKEKAEECYQKAICDINLNKGPA